LDVECWALSVGRFLKRYSRPIDSLAPNFRTVLASSMSVGLGRLISPVGTSTWTLKRF
jgi:hypothetical protein